MEIYSHNHHQYHHNTLFERRSFLRSRAPAVKWVKKWVPQDVATGGKCFTMKWVTEATLQALKEKSKELEAAEPEPKAATEILFLCSYEGCGKTFIDVGALKKHSSIHGDRQYVCHYENCGKKFLDSSKLKRHFLTHTGAKDFVCPREGCGKAFSLDFNLRAHMKTHTQENYHICQYCGKRYAHKYKLKNHIMSYHEKQNMVDVLKHIPLPEKSSKTTKSSAAAYCYGSSDRPYSCPYEGCGKAYIHEYKLNLHLRREHTGHLPDEDAKNAQFNVDNEMDEGRDEDSKAGKHGHAKVHKQSRPNPNLQLPPSKVHQQKGTTIASAANMKKPWLVKEEMHEEEDSEETEEDCDNVEDRWRYRGNGDDDEETE